MLLPIMSLVLEANGFEVEQHGLTKGFMDGGIDIVASKSGQRVFIQCKHAAVGKLSKQKIEWILYKASAFLTKASYFLSKNTTQSKVRLEIHEISMQR